MGRVGAGASGKMRSLYGETVVGIDFSQYLICTRRPVQDLTRMSLRKYRRSNDWYSCDGLIHFAQQGQALAIKGAYLRGEASKL